MERPLISIALEATQTAPFHPPILYAWVKVIPSSANLSMVGVIISSFPKACTALKL